MLNRIAKTRSAAASQSPQRDISAHIDPVSVAPRPDVARAARQGHSLTDIGIGSAGETGRASVAVRAAGQDGLRVSIEESGRTRGSVQVRRHGASAVELTDLAVDAAHRGRGLGRELIAAAAREGQRLGRREVVLSSGDKGSGKLTRWYREAGFAPRGRDERGQVRLAATLQRSGGVPARTTEAARSGGVANLFSSPDVAIQRSSERTTTRSMAVKATSSSTAKKRTRSDYREEADDDDSSSSYSSEDDSKASAKIDKKAIAQAFVSELAQAFVAIDNKLKTTKKYPKNYSVGLTDNNQIIISKVGGIANMAPLDVVVNLIACNDLYQQLDVYYASNFNSQSGNHGEMCVIAGANALGAKLSSISCSCKSCGFCAQQMADDGITNISGNGEAKSQSVWYHPRHDAVFSASAFGNSGMEAAAAGLNRFNDNIKRYGNSTKAYLESNKAAETYMRASDYTKTARVTKI
jgi:GNAT superfamily N-acetyltransferase